jgi:hypothetical protein
VDGEGAGGAVDSALVTVLTNAGVAGVVIIFLIMGWLVPKWAYSKLEEENRHLREALELERQRAGEAASTQGVTNQLIGALVDLAVERKRLTPGGGGHGEGPGLTWKDLA